jgi:hypothetical protein
MRRLPAVPLLRTARDKDAPPATASQSLLERSRDHHLIWRRYGKPFEVNAAFKIDLSGGLGGESETAQVRVSPAAGE